ncbi:predicted protein [Nematostella vectensis]|uniref:GST C-terminal domain-containing protein n=1 Tax=Nematostella vectensis TaxID=45351 RepID=A7RVG0_NEMVE|nr:eukaryotic translation elongation factor 1 epsilon-1 [Nematostella vectensis]EDO44633.1 predicted protein [Nematostella vectensis]|eukprot:XP_001636696.1 predicted protein [Nematostella vectensis]
MAAALYVNGCKNLSYLLEVCDIRDNKLIISETIEAKAPSVTFPSGVRVEGTRTVAYYLSQVACPKLLGESPLERAQIDQWLEYWQIEMIPALDNKAQMKAILQELDWQLQHRVFLVGHRLSLADVMLFMTLHTSVTEMSCQEREQLINVSRWFSTVQALLSSKTSLSMVTFPRNLLYS